MGKRGKTLGSAGPFGVEDILRVIFLKLCVKIHKFNLWLLLMISKKGINAGFYAKTPEKSFEAKFSFGGTGGENSKFGILICGRRVGSLDKWIRLLFIGEAFLGGDWRSG